MSKKCKCNGNHGECHAAKRGRSDVRIVSETPESIIRVQVELPQDAVNRLAAQAIAFLPNEVLATAMLEYRFRQALDVDLKKYLKRCKQRKA
jgi:hypothetical protein